LIILKYTIPVLIRGTMMNQLEEEEVKKLSEHIAKNEMKDLTLLLRRAGVGREVFIDLLDDTLDWIMIDVNELWKLSGTRVQNQ